MPRFVRTSMNVRVVAIGLAVLAHLVLVMLLVIERRMQRPEAATEQRQFVSLSLLPQLPQPPPRPPPPRPPPRRTAPTVRAMAPLIKTPEPVVTPTPAVAQPVVPDVVVPPPVSWESQAKSVADLYMANHDKLDYASAVIGPSALRQPCKPAKLSAEMQKKVDEALDRHPDPGPPVTSPPGSVMMNGQRVGVLTLPRKVGKESVHVIPPEELLADRKPSVPDPFTCDQP